MKVKIFQGLGKDQIQGLEHQINTWLKGDSSIKLHYTNTAAASIAAAGGSSETYQTLIVSVWYENAN